MRVYVINLKRDRERLEFVRGQLDTVGLADDVRVFRAVDGTAEWSKAKPLVAPAAAKRMAVIQRQGYCDHHGELVSKGAVGCGLSHAGVWTDILRSDDLGENEPVLVLEDDAVFVSRNPKAVIGYTLKHAPKDWDLFLLGFKIPTVEGKDEAELVDHSHAFHDEPRVFWGTHMYLITKRAAARLMTLDILPMRAQIDVFSALLARKGMLKVFALKKSIAAQKRFGSRIQLDRAVQAEHGAPDFEDFVRLASKPRGVSKTNLLALTKLAHGRVSVLE